MARARSGGSTTTYAVATVLFAILFVFSLILAIIFYSRVAKAELTARLAVNDLRQFISSDQRGQQRLVMLEAMAGDEKKTIYELMTEEAATLRAIVNGNDTADIMTVQAQYKEVVSVEGRPLVGEVQQLQAELAELGTQIKVLTDQLEQQKVVAQEAIEANVELAAKYEQAKREDDAKYEELRTEFAQHQQKFEAGIEQIDSVLGEKLSTAQKDRRPRPQ